TLGREGVPAQGDRPRGRLQAYRIHVRGIQEQVRTDAWAISGSGAGAGVVVGPSRRTRSRGAGPCPARRDPCTRPSRPPPARRPETKKKAPGKERRRTPGEQRGTPGGPPWAPRASSQRLTGTGLAIRARRFERPAWGTKEFLGRWRKPAVAPPATAERSIP